MRTILHNKTFSKSTALQVTPLHQFKVASYKRSGIRLSFEDNNTASRGRGREESLRLRCLEKCSPSMQFYQELVQDFSYTPATLVCYIAVFSVVTQSSSVTTLKTAVQQTTATQNSLNIPIALQAWVTLEDGTTYTTVPVTIFHDATFNINFVNYLKITHDEENNLILPGFKRNLEARAGFCK